MAHKEKHQQRHIENVSPIHMFTERMVRWYKYEPTPQDYHAILKAIRERVLLGTGTTSFTDSEQKLYSGEDGQVWRVVHKSKSIIVLTGKVGSEVLIPLPPDCVTEEVAQNRLHYYRFHPESIDLLGHKAPRLPIDFDDLKIPPERE